MALLQTINLGVRFALELCLLAAFGYWGFQLERGWLVRIVAGIGLPLLVAVVWGMFIAPKAPYLLAEPGRFLLELLLFASGAGMLWLAERPFLGAALLIIFLINRGLMGLWGQ
ncbi:MAG: YrdB family protein [Chloroflexota bacterium]